MFSACSLTMLHHSFLVPVLVGWQLDLSYPSFLLPSELASPLGQVASPDWACKSAMPSYAKVVLPFETVALPC